MQSTLLEKTTSGKFWTPNSVGPVCMHCTPCTPYCYTPLASRTGYISALRHISALNSRLLIAVKQHRFIQEGWLYRQLNVRQLSSLRPWDHRGKCHMDRKRIQCLSNASQHVPIYLQPFLRYSGISVASEWFSTVFVSERAFLTTFCFPLGMRPWYNRDKCHTVGKRIQCL